MRILLLFGVLVLGSHLFAQTPGGGVMDIDGNDYTTVIIGNQEWMSENLRVARYSNGDSISNVIDDNSWQNLSTGAWASYSHDQLYDSIYGKLYNWYTVLDSRSVCPQGWHVPTHSEFTVLTDNLGGEPVAGGKMKTTGTIQGADGIWEAPNSGADNSSNFNATPSGSRWFDGSFSPLGFYARYWTSTEDNSSNAHHRRLAYDNTYAEELSPEYKPNGFNIRCLKDSTSVGIIELNNDENRKIIKIVDLTGRETEYKPNTPLIFIYSDGTRERVMKLEE